MSAVRKRRRVVAVVELVAGMFALTIGGVVFVGHAAMNGPDVGDLGGIVLTIAGAVLLVLAGRSAFAGTRRRTKLLVLPLAFVLLQFWLLPVVLTGAVATNAPRDAPAPAISLGIAGARDVAFRACDGVMLRGWYVPGARKRLVLVLHGSHGTRSSTVDYVDFLHAAGYPVLAYDSRGHGASGGAENAYGWNGHRDVIGAVRWARAHGIRSVAALGLSMGAEEALRAAAAHSGLSAVVADGAGASTLGDSRLEQDTRSPLFTAVTWLAMRSVSIFSGDREPRPLASVVRSIRVPVLLIASNRRFERRIDGVFANRIGAHARLWYVTDAGHTQAFSRHPAEYRQRVLRLLAAAS